MTAGWRSACYQPIMGEAENEAMPTRPVTLAAFVVPLQVQRISFDASIMDASFNYLLCPSRRICKRQRECAHLPRPIHPPNGRRKSAPVGRIVEPLSW